MRFVGCRCRCEGECEHIQIKYSVQLSRAGAGTASGRITPGAAMEVRNDDYAIEQELFKKYR